MTPPLVLASASPTRQAILEAAGISAIVEPSGVTETGLSGPTREVAAALARQKALAVASRRNEGLVLGCDSLLDLDGVALGKPTDSREAIERWRALRGAIGVLYTGHALVDAASGRLAEEVVGTEVRFGAPSDAEIAAYVASGEPLDKAGAFTLEGRSAAFLDGIVGDASNVRGLSLAALRRLLTTLGASLLELWRP